MCRKNNGKTRRGMNTNLIKQLLQDWAKQIAVAEDSYPTEAGQDELGVSTRSDWEPLGRYNGYHALVEQITKITDADGHWSHGAVDYMLWDFSTSVSRLQREEREDVAKLECDALIEQFKKDPSRWVVEHLVFGFHKTCEGLTFGKMDLVTHDASALEGGGVGPAGVPEGTMMFARLETDAGDETSAVEISGDALDEHLLVINALFSHGGHQTIQVSRSDRLRPSFSATRATRINGPAGPIRTSNTSDRMPLTRPQLEDALKHTAGSRLSSMLASGPSEVERRILSGYAFAGAACTDRHPERRFMMFAIALESVILGKNTQSELAYQLGARVAHLIGKGLDGRQTVAATINNLYRRRSRIVHTGEYGVSRSEAALMWFYCMSALSMLLASPALVNFKLNNELEDWFSQRMLGGPDHYSEELKGSAS
jgi:hypothetical protein